MDGQAETGGWGRSAVAGLRALRTSAPGGLLPATLAAVGLADRWAEVEGPIGPLLVAWGERGITAIERAEDAAGFEAEYTLRLGRALVRVPSLPEPLAHQVRRRLAGERTRGPDIDLVTLTEFERAVLHKTMEIPYGEIRPYAWVAREIGRPRAVRAVGSALAANPVPFVIPCHRVVRADGRIGEYGAGGPEAKARLLRHEGVEPRDVEGLADRGVRYVGSRTTNIFCYPTCRHARRIAERHRVAFRDGVTARDAGYRACRVCRPIEAPVFGAALMGGSRGPTRAPLGR